MNKNDVKIKLTQIVNSRKHYLPDEHIDAIREAITLLSGNDADGGKPIAYGLLSPESGKVCYWSHDKHSVLASWENAPYGNYANCSFVEMCIGKITPPVTHDERIELIDQAIAARGGA